MMQQEEQLRQELEELKKKLEAAQNWMRREIEGQIKNVISEKTHGEIGSLGNGFEEKISEKIHSFFSDILLIQTPENVLDNLIMSEVEYELVKAGNTIDPLSVIISYQKVLDACIERFITQNFRKYAIKQGCIQLSGNHHLEKTFHSIINDGYIFGVNKFFLALLEIKNSDQKLPYLQCFENFLEKRKQLGNIFFQDVFLEMSDTLLKSDIFGGKRHSGKISLEEIKNVRNILIGNFETKSCLLYKLFETQKIDI